MSENQFESIPVDMARRRALQLLASGAGLTLLNRLRRHAPRIGPAFAQAETPAMLQQFRDLRPRLFVTTERVAFLREAITTTHAHLWRELAQYADIILRTPPPAYQPGPPDDGQLWQREVGDRMINLAMAALLSDDPRYFTGARDWALTAAGYPTWGIGSNDGRDLAAGHQLFGISLVYDWLFDRLDESTRQILRATLRTRAPTMAEMATRTPPNANYWQAWYLQNHLWVNMAGLLAAGLATFDDVAEASRWIAIATGKFDATLALLADDGASIEGVPYWGYGVDALLKFMDLARALLGSDHYDHAWFRNTAFFRLYLGLPRGGWLRGSRTVVNLADGRGYDWYGPDHLLRGLAREYRNGYAQWLADAVDDANVDSPTSRWLNLVWHDPTVTPAPPDDLPTLRHFEDMAIVSARSDWSGDESLVVFRCGPPMGHKVARTLGPAADPGGGHAHPDAGHFVVFGAGEWQIRDDGYAHKLTGYHNTLLISGAGQLGEGDEFFRPLESQRTRSDPRVTRVLSLPELDHVTGDATAAYPAASGLRRFTRHLLFLKPNVLIVADDIETERPLPLELRFFPESQNVSPAGNADWLAMGERSVLRITPQTVTDVSVSLDTVSLRLVEPGDSVSTLVQALRLRTERSHWRTYTVFAWGPSLARLPVITVAEQGDLWQFQGPTSTVTFDWYVEEASFQARR